MSDGVAEELYELAHHRGHSYFVDVLDDICRNSSLNSRQLDILIKLDFFSDYGNQRELLRITDLYSDLFKRGDVKKLSKDKIDGTPLEPIVSRYSVGVTKTGQFSKSYTVLDIDSILRETEDAVKAARLEDLSDLVKVRNFVDVMGYAGYVSGKEEDRRKLYVADVFPVHRKKDGRQFGYTVLTKSIGSGVESRFTVFNPVYNKDPLKKGDIIYCSGFQHDGQYFTLTGYNKVY